MAKRKINAAMILAAGEDAHLQTNEKVSHAKPIDGETFLELNVEDIKNNPMQPRLHIDEEELKGLARSIKLHGLIQPIAVIKVGQSDYILKAGQRRWLAHKQLGLPTIKAIVQEETILPKKESDKALFEIAVLENTQRDNLNPLELALSLRQAMDKKLYTNMEELSQALGKSKSYVSKVMKVLSLEDEIIKDLSKNKSTNDIEALYEIQKIKDVKEQSRVYFDFIVKKLDRKALRELNKKEVSHAKVPYKIENRAKKVKVEFDVSILKDSDIKKINEEIEEVLKKYL
ncbi:MAG TPA: ParB/RepB/Spo0J family partition protein [Campylobacterales bacterium]|nr:ParB/RepB/Spo0J family partition protein [Campylobacterales bacterium]